MIVTTTFSPSLSDMRAQLAIRTVKVATARGFRIVVIDGSPCEEFKQALADAGANVRNQTIQGMGASRREALHLGLLYASDAKAIVWMEPEKHSLVELLDDCIAPVVKGDAEIVVPRRLAFKNYPAYQAESEAKANAEIAAITEWDLDLYIGPRIMSRQAAALMAKYDGKVDGQQVYGDKWEILFIPILWFMANGWRIESVTVDYVHPIEQLVEDDAAMRAKRDEQRTVLVSAMRQEFERIRAAA